ncbi:MAG: helix-turn-helix domain-containing protein [Pirellulaceae bacterium]
MTKTKDFAKVIRRRLAGDSKLREGVEQELLGFSIAALLYEQRSKAGLTQKELAEMADTHQSVIARLEDADYSGHSLTMLARIAAALGAELKIDFVSRKPARPGVEAGRASSPRRGKQRR